MQSFIKHVVRIANYLWRFERDTGVKMFAYSNRSRSSPPPSFFLIFHPLHGWCALTFAGIMPCMFGYLKLSMVLFNRRPHQWPNASQKDVSFISIPANRAHPKQYSSPTLTYFWDKGKEHEWTYASSRHGSPF